MASIMQEWNLVSFRKTETIWLINAIVSVYYFFYSFETFNFYTFETDYLLKVLLIYEII